MENYQMTPNHTFAKLKGKTLGSVEFVHDYVQLRFDGSTLTAYTWPVLTVGSNRFVWGSEGYKDSLCSEIGIAVRDVSLVDGKEISIFLQDGAALTISFQNEDYQGPEAIQFVSDDGSVWVG